MSLADFRLTAQPVRAAWAGPRLAAAGLTILLTGAIVAAFAASVADWTPASLVALPLVALSALWISGGAATALLGLAVADAPRSDAPPGWRPASRTAILVTLCREAPEPVARHLASLREGLGRAGMGQGTEIFVLSDTSGAEAIAREQAAFRPLAEAGVLHYRRRDDNAGRKPGNIGAWVDSHGAAHDHMLVLDADSRMTAARIRRLVWQMDRRPDLGLLQAGIALLPGRTRFGRHQRVAARLLSRGFGRGLAAWSGDSGNYWGHNAIMRVAAFRAARRLPELSGQPPWGGMLLSHDFVEAAWIRRAGWAVALDPATAGSAEEAPQTLRDFHARDRRWCQGNLQHLRLIAEPGLDPVSRLHLAMGILGYLVAPVWLILVAIVALGVVPVAGALPLAVAAAVLLLPKACALVDWWRAARTARRRMTILRASLGELAVSSLVAPLVMLRQAGAVASICLGRDCGWKAPGPAGLGFRPGLAEAAAGWAILAAALAVSGPSAAWLAPVALPLGLAPLVIGVMERG
ncbi:MAG: glucans biosynthesis glucosyltransferase MdoH [Roseicyclus sp.]